MFFFVFQLLLLLLLLWLVANDLQTGVDTLFNLAHLSVELLVCFCFCFFVVTAVLSFLTLLLFLLFAQTVFALLLALGTLGLVVRFQTVQRVHHGLMLVGQVLQGFFQIARQPIFGMIADEMLL